MATTMPHSLGATAFWTASVRALESARADRLIDDPWAAALAGKEGAAWISQRPAESVLPIVLRIRYFDDCLQRIAAEGAIRQVVLLASGLDTRAFRLGLPAQIRCFEMDQPAVLAHKERVLSEAAAVPTCVRHAVGADLTGDWREPLVGAGFDPQLPSAWLLEGFLFYLTNDAITRILDQVTSLAAPASWLGFDIVNGVMLVHPLTRAWLEMQAKAGAPWIGTMDDPIGYLAERGWQAGLSQAGAGVEHNAIDANHGRWPYPVIPVTMPDMPHNWFVTARRRVGRTTPR